MSKEKMVKNELAGTKVLLLEGFARQVMPMMQALHDLDCHITTYNKSKLDMGYSSRYPDKKIIAYWDRNDDGKSYRALLEILKAEQYDVVIPMTDFSATMLSRHRDEILQYAHPAVNEWKVFMGAGDKLNTMIACMDNGIPCPRTLRSVSSMIFLFRVLVIAQKLHVVLDVWMTMIP